jgi:hypothetical protein
MNLQFSVLSSQFSVLSSQFSVLSSQFSERLNLSDENASLGCSLDRRNQSVENSA